MGYVDQRRINRRRFLFSRAGSQFCLLCVTQLCSSIKSIAFLQLQVDYKPLQSFFAAALTPSQFNPFLAQNLPPWFNTYWSFTIVPLEARFSCNRSKK